MSPRLIIRLVVPAALVAGAALAFNGDPPTAKTGAPAIGGKPAEGTCADCHNDFAINTSGSVEILNAPTHYQPGTTYTMTVRVTSSQTSGYPDRLWGFQLTAVRVSDGSGAGTFTDVSGQGTMVASGTGQFASRSYIEVANNDHMGAPSPVDWQVRWTAPNPGVDQVRFYLVGNAADGAGGTGGDWVYTGSFTTNDVTPVSSTTWGAIKARYR